MDDDGYIAWVHAKEVERDKQNKRYLIFAMFVTLFFTPLLMFGYIKFKVEIADLVHNVIYDTANNIRSK